MEDNEEEEEGEGLEKEEALEEGAALPEIEAPVLPDDLRAWMSFSDSLSLRTGLEALW